MNGDSATECSLTTHQETLYLLCGAFLVHQFSYGKGKVVPVPN
jgi:hypothetical protein